MKTKTSCTLEKIAIFSLLTVTLIYAFTENSFSTIENKSDTVINKSYQTMSTAQLQEEVEKRSMNGNLPFDMGMELIKRWTDSTTARRNKKYSIKGNLSFEMRIERDKRLTKS